MYISNSNHCHADDNNIHLEEGELLLGKGSNGAGDEGALGEPAIELGQECLIPGHLLEFF